MKNPLIQSTSNGLYCQAGDFYIDPWRPVEYAVITHAHADHARPYNKRYLCSDSCLPLLKERVHKEAHIESIPYGKPIVHNEVNITLHPAGHLLGSSQIQVEHKGESWVVSGDYKLEMDSTCEPFEPVPCHTFITESTFGLPIYRWKPQQEVFASINHWWKRNQENHRTSVIFSYALGKAQRVLAGIDSSIGPILLHGAVMRFHDLYQNQNVTLPHAEKANPDTIKQHKGNALIVAPPSAMNSPWFRKLQPASTAFASGWMQIRGNRRRRAVDQGFVLSDHADWPGLNQTILITGAENIGVTHGTTDVMVRWLQENGYNAWEMRSEYTGENDDATDEISEEDQTQSP